MNEILLYFVTKYKGEWNNIFSAIKNKELINKNDYLLFLEKINEKKLNYLTVLDSSYPQKLLRLNQPPFILFYKGNLDILKEENNSIYLTGSYKTEEIKKYLENLKYDNQTIFFNCLWSGLEKEILKILFTKKFKIVIILPCGIEWGLNNLNLKEFDNENCLFLSEFPNDYHVSKTAFISRNRINACFCKKLVLLSSLENKFNNLVNEFLDQGKDIQCLLFKDRNENDTNINLINQGAELINENINIL
ncbi:DNA-processing protein DprA [Metamycoplasma canadense]|nr:DNA-processing protein DprA [Metamycoplasma canadense]